MNKIFHKIKGEIHMKPAKMKKEISIFFVFMLLAAILTGCSDISTIRLNEDGSGSFEETTSVSKQLWDVLLADAGNDDMIKDSLTDKYPSAEVTIEDAQVNGVESKKINMKMNLANEDGLQKVLNAMGINSVQYNQRYFSRGVIASPDDTNSASDSFDSISDDLGSVFGENEDLLNALSEELKNMDVQTTITFPYTVKDTNGSLQEDGKTVIWGAKQLSGQGASRLYATFSEQNSKEAPKFRGAKNGKYYNTVVTLNVNSDNLLNYVTVNGKKYESDYLSISSEGSYKVVATDKNKNKSTIKFQIDTTKPSIKGIKDNKTYKKAVVVKFSDKGSGIKKATLNGKKISSGKKITKKGSYTLNLTDRAGNSKTAKFKIS